MPTTILFVCTGNLCRSPMAEGFLRARLEENKGGDYRVRSAGTWAVEEARASRNAVYVMAEHGIDLGTHRAHLLTIEDVQEADLILAMAQEHADAITSQLPEDQDKVRLLTEVAGRTGDVEDPYGANLGIYQETADQISWLINEAFDEILRLTREDHL